MASGSKIPSPPGRGRGNLEQRREGSSGYWQMADGARSPAFSSAKDNGFFSGASWTFSRKLFRGAIYKQILSQGRLTDPTQWCKLPISWVARPPGAVGHERTRKGSKPSGRLRESSFGVRRVLLRPGFLPPERPRDEGAGEKLKRGTTVCAFFSRTSEKRVPELTK